MSERLTLTVEEAGKLLGISRAHAYELVARNELPNIRLGRRVLVPRRALDALLETASAPQASQRQVSRFSDGWPYASNADDQDDDSKPLA